MALRQLFVDWGHGVFILAGVVKDTIRDTPNTLCNLADEWSPIVAIFWPLIVGLLWQFAAPDSIALAHAYIVWAVWLAGVILPIAIARTGECSR